MESAKKVQNALRVDAVASDGAFIAPVDRQSAETVAEIMNIMLAAASVAENRNPESRDQEEIVLDGQPLLELDNGAQDETPLLQDIPKDIPQDGEAQAEQEPQGRAYLKTTSKPANVSFSDQAQNDDGGISMNLANNFQGFFKSIGGAVFSAPEETGPSGFSSFQGAVSSAGYTGANISHYLQVLAAANAASQVEREPEDLVLNGTGGFDVLRGGAGDDTISGGAGDDDLFGEGGDDTIYGEDGDDTIYGGAGDDTIYGGAGQDIIHGESGNDTIYSGENGAYIYAGAGNDVIDLTNGGTSSAYDYVEGGDGDDVITNGGTGDEIFGGAGNDTIGVATAYVEGGEGNDVITFTGENSEIYGDEGDDIINLRGSSSSVYGGSGEDDFVFVYSSGYGTNNSINDFTFGDDSLDLSQLLDHFGFYDPLYDLISDFVRITDNGTHSTIAIDFNGGGNSFTTLASLNNFTDFTVNAVATEGELQALIANGSLIVT